MNAIEARKVSEENRKRIEWYNKAGRKLINAMREIERAVRDGKRSVDVYGMDMDVAVSLLADGYKLKTKKLSFPVYVDTEDGGMIRAWECTEISW